MDSQGFSGQAVGDTALNIAGRGLGALAALVELGHGGSPFQLLAQRNELLQDPGFRGSAGPFSSGFLQIGGQHAPTSLPPGPALNAFQRAGIEPGQYIPNLPPLSQQAALKERLLGSASQGLSQMPPEQQERAGLDILGVKHTVDPYELAQRLGGEWQPSHISAEGGLSLEPKPLPGGNLEPVHDTAGNLIPNTYRDVSNNRIVQVGTQPAPTQGPGEYQVWQRQQAPGSDTSMTAFWQARNNAAITRAQGLAGVKEEYAKLPVAAQNTLATIDTMKDVTDKVAALLQDPTVRADRGLFEGRLRQTLYLAGLATDPNEDSYIALANFTKIMGVQPFMRGTRNFEFVKQIQDHLPKPGDQPELIEAKIGQMAGYLASLRKNIISASGKRISQLQAEEGGGGAPGQKPAPTGSQRPGLQLPNGYSFEVQ